MTRILVDKHDVKLLDLIIFFSVSWTCLRSQILDPAAVRTSAPASKSPSSMSSYCGETWFQDEHDWGGNDNDGNGNTDNLNLASSSQLYLDNMAKSGGGRSNLNNINSNTTSITEVTQKMESKLNIIEVGSIILKYFTVFTVYIFYTEYHI